MAYQTLRPFNQSLAGKIPGYCLQNVRKGFSIGAKYPTAITAWWATKQHKDRNIPTGIDVPLFYSYKLSGHVNVRLANGKVWSDGVTYASLAAYESTHPDVHYLGWGESLNGVPVIQYVQEASFALPPSGSRIQLIPTQTRTTYKAGTATVAGHINVTDNSFVYTVRGHDSTYPNRVLINSATGGGNGVSLALYYLSGARISGWKEI